MPQSRAIRVLIVLLLTFLATGILILSVFPIMLYILGPSDVEPTPELEDCSLDAWGSRRNNLRTGLLARCAEVLEVEGNEETEDYRFLDLCAERERRRW